MFLGGPCQPSALLHESVTSTRSIDVDILWENMLLPVKGDERGKLHVTWLQQCIESRRG